MTIHQADQLILWALAVYALLVAVCLFDWWRTRR